jgi:four helix bundle protein
MTFESWKEQVPDSIQNDPLWGMRVYRAVGSVGANVAEGYSRGTGKDRARFYEYALGSARESRDWYFKGRFVLGEEVTQHRLNFMTEIIRLLLSIVPEQRGGKIQEPSPSYGGSDERVERLLEDIPLAS